MDSARWERIQSLFHAASDLPRDSQAAFLRSACGADSTLIPDVMALLDEDAAGSSLLDRGISEAASRMLALPEGLAARQFGPYRLARVIGEGGSGVVYLAERDDLRTQVAIKFLRDAWLSPGRRERFASEQRTLAQLTHPSIARLYDAGTLTDGTPWFVMEYVEGVPIADFCAAQQCSIEQRLRLFRAVCEAVAYAHGLGIIHRDLKPSNILVKPDGAVRLLDFGIAKQRQPIDGAVASTQTGLRLMTPAYASPEQIRGEAVDVPSDVYSLGVVLYELIAGRLPFDFTGLTPDEAVAMVIARDAEKPSLAAPRGAQATSRRAWTDLDVLCATAMHKDPRRRYSSVPALIADVDRFLEGRPLDARPDAVWYTLAKFARRHRTRVYVAAAVVAAVAAAWVGRGAMPAAKPADPVTATWRTVAVLPFQNAGADAGLDFLRLALADEIATILSHTRSISVRPFATTSRYDAAGLDVQQAGRDMRADAVVTGHFLRAGEILRITLEAIEVDSNRLLWRDMLDAPANNLIATQAQIGLRVRGGLATALGWSAADATARPRDEEAYGLFLRTAALKLDPSVNAEAIRMLERSVALDPRYAPAWHALARRYYVEGRYGAGGAGMVRRFEDAMERALSLDPSYVAPAAGLALSRVEQGDLVTAYAQAAGLVRRRPDSIDAHFALSYVLRYAGLLDEAAGECDTAFLLDPRTQTQGLRSCSVVFLLKGDSVRAMNFVDLDHGSDYAKALSIHILVRDGKDLEALAIGAPQIPQWNSFDMLLACLRGAPDSEIIAKADAVNPSDDPETNYFSASHMARCGQTARALDLLRRAVNGKFCGYPAMDTDPYFTRLRALPEFADIRSSGMACQSDFLARRRQGSP